MDEEGSVDSDRSQTGLTRESSSLEKQQVLVLPCYQGLKDVAEALVIDVVTGK
jgi:hypothetical protein